MKRRDTHSRVTTRTVPTRARPLLLALAAVLAALVLAVPASAAGWTDPQTLSASGGYPALAVDRDGKAIVLWGYNVPNDAGLQADVHPLGGTGWNPVDTLAHRPCVGECWVTGYWGPRVGIDDRGDAVALWQWGGPSAGNMALDAAVRPAGGTWQPLPFPDSTYWNLDYSLAVAPDGGAVSVTNNFGNFGLSVVQARTRAPGGPWSAAQVISDPGTSLEQAGEDAHDPQVAVDAAGGATAVWSGKLGVRAAERPAGGAWTSPVRLGAGVGSLIAVNPSGQAAALWLSSEDSPKAVVMVARRARPGGAWSAPVAVSAAGAQVPALAIDPGGKVVATWVGADGKARAAVQPLLGGWAATVLGPASTSGGGPQVALNPAGTAFVTYLGPTGAVMVGNRPAGGAWGAPQPRSSAGASGVRVAADANGNAVVAWLAASGAVQAEAYDATGPVLAGLAVPTSATAGRPVAASLAPWDLWSDVPSVSWDFGDGATATGLATSHVYSTPGVYPVTVRAADALGNVSGATREISVAPAPTTPTQPAGPVDSATVFTTGTTGTVAGVSVNLPGATPASQPAPTRLSPAARKRLPRLRLVIHAPRAMRAGVSSIVPLTLSRRVRGALATVQLRRGLGYRTIARGRISGRRIAVTVSVARPGRYLLRVLVAEAGLPRVSRVVVLSVR